MRETQRPLKVFLCHAHSDKNAVREADVVVVCLSKQFNEAGFRRKDVRLALDIATEKPEGKIFIVPARLEECDNLESLRKWHPYEKQN